MNKDTVEEFWTEDAVLACAGRASEASVSDFADSLLAFLGSKGSLSFEKSGSYGLELFLRALASSSQKKTVLICDFNCRLVAQAVLKAGLQVGIYDLAEHPGELDWQGVLDKLNDDTLAVVVPHFFGVPVDFSVLTGKCEKLGVRIVEDCCHSLGGTINGKMAGTVADAAMFSFGYDKPMSLGGGGAFLVNNPDLCKLLPFKREVEKSPRTVKGEQSQMREFSAYLRRHRVHIPRFNYFWRLYRKFAPLRLPVIGDIGALRAELGLWQLARYPDIVRARNNNAQRIACSGKLKSWSVGPGVSPAWLKQKILLPSSAEVNMVSKKLRGLGIRAGNYNWSLTMGKLLGLQEEPNAARLAACGLELPIHQNITEQDLQVILEVLSPVLLQAS